MLLSRALKFAVLGCAILAAGCDRQSGEKAQPQASASAPDSAGLLTGKIDRSHKGSELPDMTLADAQGRQLRLKALAGKPLLVNLWATWCAPCVIELPMLDRLAADKTGELRVLTVALDMSRTERVAPFLAERGLTHLEPWIDPENKLAFHYGAGTLPTTIYYNASGQEVWRYTGGHDWTGAEAAGMLAEGR